MKQGDNASCFFILHEGKIVSKSMDRSGRDFLQLMEVSVNWLSSSMLKICLDQGRISVLSLVHRSEDFQNSSIVDYLFLLQWKQKFHRQIRLPQWAFQRPTPISGRHCHESILLKVYPYLQRRRTCLLILHSQIGQNQKTQRRCNNWIHLKGDLFEHEVALKDETIRKETLITE